MNLRHKIALSCFSATILAFGCLVGAVAQTSPYTYENGTEAASRGIIDVNDAKFDSTDLSKIYTEVYDGKTAIANQINTTAGAGTVLPTGNNGTFYTFEDLANSIPLVKQSGISELAGAIKDSKSSNSAYDSFSTTGSTTDIVNSLNTAIETDNTNHYNAGLAEGALNSSYADIQITRHHHTDACKCGGEVVANGSNTQNMDYTDSAGQHYSYTNYYYTCTRCSAYYYTTYINQYSTTGAFKGSWVSTSTYPGTVCTANNCGLDETDIEKLVINGKEYEFSVE